MRTKMQPGENVALIVKRHWFVLVKPFLLFFSSFLLLPFGQYNPLGLGPLIKSSFAYVLLGVGAYLIYAVLDRKYDIWIVTNRRLIDEWGIITNNSKENSLDKINDIEIKQTVSGRMFDYADISVQTAAEKGETAITFIEKPRLLKETINALREDFELFKGKTPSQKGMPIADAGHPSSYTLFLDEKSIHTPCAINCPHCGSQIKIVSTKAVISAPPIAKETPPTEKAGAVHEPKQQYRLPIANPKGWEK